MKTAVYRSLIACLLVGLCAPFAAAQQGPAGGFSQLGFPPPPKSGEAGENRGQPVFQLGKAVPGPRRTPARSGRCGGLECVAMTRRRTSSDG